LLFFKYFFFFQDTRL